MHILYIHQHFSTPQGATGTRSYENALSLIEHGHEVTMLCGSHRSAITGLHGNFKSNLRKGNVNGINVIEVNQPYSNNTGFLKRYWIFISFVMICIPILLKSKYDLIFATSTPLTVGLLGMIGKWFKRKPFVFEVRDLWPELPKAMGVIKNPLILKILSLIEWSSYKSADRIIGLAPGIVSGIAKFRIETDRIHLIPNGCDIEFFDPLKNNKWSPIETENSKFVAVYSGTLGHANGVENIILCAKELKDRNRDDIIFIIAGDGSRKKTIEKMIKHYQLNNVYLVGLLEKTKISELINMADLGIQSLRNVPEFYRGTSPNKFFDYIATGTAVVTNYPGWISELIEENNCGYTVPPEDHSRFADILEEAADHPMEVKNKSINALLLANSKFNRKELTTQFVEVLERAHEVSTPSSVRN